LKREFITKRLHPGKKPLEETIEKKITIIEGSKFSWIDLQNPNRDDVKKLAEKYHFNELNIEDCMTKFELSKLDNYDDHIFFILHFPPLASKQVLAKYRSLWELVFLLQFIKGN